MNETKVEISCTPCKTSNNINGKPLSIISSGKKSCETRNAIRERKRSFAQTEGKKKRPHFLDLLGRTQFETGEEKEEKEGEKVVCGYQATW